MQNNLLIDLGPELQLFRGIVCELDMSTIDLEACLQNIFDCLTDLMTFKDKLYNMATWMAEQDGLFENHELSEDSKCRIHAAVVRLGMSIKNNLESLHAYSQDTFPFEFRRLIDGETLLLSRLHPG